MSTQLTRWVCRSLGSRIGASASSKPFNELPSRRTVSSYQPVPFITETIGGMTHTTDLYSRLLKERIILLNGPVEDQGSAQIIASMLFLDVCSFDAFGISYYTNHIQADNPEKPISLYINSPGGSVTAGLAIYDTMTYIQAEVSTICIGQAASMGSLLLAGGAPGKRYALPHSSVMLHQPSGGYAGQAADIAIHAKEILRVRDSLNKIYQRHMTGKKQLSLDEIERLLDRDTFLAAPEALEMGLIDEILDRRVKLEEAPKP